MKKGGKPSLPHYRPLENCHFRSKKEMLCTFLHTTVTKTKEIGETFEIQLESGWLTDTAITETDLESSFLIG
jgi:hypothetical protein